MRSTTCVLIVSICGAALLCAQTNPPPSTPPAPSSSSGSSSSSDKSTTNYVRRISVGATLSVQGLGIMKGGSSTVATASNVNTGYTSTNASERLGYGVTAQVGVTDHFAVAFGAFLRRIGYQLTTSVATTTNVLEGSTVVPTVTTTSTHEDTRGSLIDIPIMLRYFKKSRHTPGARWFVEGGGAWREVRNIRSAVDATDASGVLTCCTFTPTPATNHTVRGLIAGAGIQLIDPLGIRVVPEVRYTRWTNEIFNINSAHMQRNQVEVAITLSF
jgi:hypothetical protein